MSSQFSLGGKILNVDLSTGRIETEPTADYAERFLGAAGINTWKLLEGVDASVSALDAQNKLAFGAGTLVGTLAPSASRVNVVSKNVMTGGFGSASAGGFFSSELKCAGYDSIIVTGRAKKPVYLFIDDGDVAIEDAAFLWGQTTWDTEALLKRKIGDDRLGLLTIGPAGENLVSAANIMVSLSRSASRCGVGAVMGSKNLKAVAVRGTGYIEVADPEGFFELSSELTRKLGASDTAKMLREYGTPSSFTAWNALSNVPVRNFQQTHIDAERVQGLDAKIYKEDHDTRTFGCFSCPIHCSHFNQIRKGAYAGTQGEKIECQNLWDFGAKLDINSFPGVLKSSSLCSQLGLDVSSTTGAISWAFECYQRGILTHNETDGLRLEWGDHAVVIEVLRKMAYQEGFGRLLRKGSLEAARTIGKGSEQYAMHVRGQELAEEFRVLKGWALGIMVGERGGGHTTGSPLTERMDIPEDLSRKIFGVPTAGDPDTYEGKAQLVVYYQRYHAVLESLGVCHIASNWAGPEMMGPEDVTQLYNAATGRNLSTEELLWRGERIHTLQKMFNVRHTPYRREDDYPPARLMNEQTTGGNQGKGFDRSRWSAMLDEYYDLHGWDRGTGVPHRKSLEALGLGELAS